ncbi:MAG TPA: response regulator [Blastocatellia bacterium]
MAKDKYKYFRIEAREILDDLGRCVLQLEGGAGRKENIARILRLAHTLKGAARVVEQPGIAQSAHSLEDIFAQYREDPGSLAQSHVNQALALVDEIARGVAALDQQPAKAAEEASSPVAKGNFETVRIELEEADKLLESVAEAAAQLHGLEVRAASIARTRQLAADLLQYLYAGAGPETRASMPAWMRARSLAVELCQLADHMDRTFAPAVSQVRAEFEEVRDAADRLRLLPVTAIFGPLERAVRDAAQALNKQVTFEAAGGDNRLEGHVLSPVRDAMLHLVRNAVAHGIEPAAERMSSGKGAQGHVRVTVSRHGHSMAFKCSDDGRGIDVEAIRGAAVRGGLVTVSQAAAFTMDEVIHIIMKGGVSTAGAIDEVSGRGIGLDVVHEIATRLKAEVTVRSEPRAGTTVEIRVPLSLSSMHALEVDVGGGNSVFLPLDSVRRVIRITKNDIVRTEGSESLLHDGKMIPYLPLSRALGKAAHQGRNGRGSNRDAPAAWAAVVIEGPAGAAATGVDRLLGASNIVVRPLPSLARAEPVIAGAVLDAEGNPQLVLDSEPLIAAALVSREPAITESVKARPPILVVDDSLTTRMLEQSILESAGYQVDLATSGEEALAKARANQYGLFLVDVEMPGIDGFEFVSRTQSDARLSSVPSILVTSRSAAEDRRRGEEAGARGYILKGEFDQGFLLQSIRELIG